MDNLPFSSFNAEPDCTISAGVNCTLLLDTLKPFAELTILDVTTEIVCSLLETAVTDTVFPESALTFFNESFTAALILLSTYAFTLAYCPVPVPITLSNPKNDLVDVSYA
jgi:hypothetical protein